jgi:hypothetical protein
MTPAARARAGTLADRQIFERKTGEIYEALIPTRLVNELIFAGLC